MKIAVIGAGYVGLVTAACFSEFGYEVICIDNDKYKIKQLKKNIIPIYEPGLSDLVKKNAKSKYLLFSNSISKVRDANIIFIAVGTPSSRRGDGEADLKFVFSVVNDISKFLKKGKKQLVITKSTVPVGTGKKIQDMMCELRPDLINKFSTASVPHGVGVQTAFLTDGDQQRKSWYMFFFQLPLAEISVPMNEYEFIHRLWREWSPNLSDYKKYSNNVVNVLSKSNVLSKALAYYRCSFQASLQLERINTKLSELLGTKIKPPCLYFHGKNDGCIDYKLADGMQDFYQN